MTREKRVPLFQRLPEIYRIKDAEQQPPDQLRAYLELVEDAFGAIHENIESLYHDLFIETCDDWVIPYIGDLLGTSSSQRRGADAARGRGRHDCAAPAQGNTRRDRVAGLQPDDAGAFIVSSCARIWSGTSTSTISGRTTAAGRPTRLAARRSQSEYETADRDSRWHRDAARSGAADAAQHAFRSLRAHRGPAAAGQRQHSLQPAESRDLSLAPRRLSHTRYQAGLQTRCDGAVAGRRARSRARFVSVSIRSIVRIWASEQRKEPVRLFNTNLVAHQRPTRRLVSIARTTAAGRLQSR